MLSGILFFFTGVSIHFPDGNKNSEVRKSNQVSINSRQEQLSGLEAARKDIRQLTPLVFSFVLPAAARIINLDNDPTMLRLKVQTYYNVQVSFSLLKQVVFIASYAVLNSIW